MHHAGESTEPSCPQTTPLVRLTLAALALAGLVGACSGEGSGDSDASTSSDEEVSAAAAPGETASGWEKVVPGGDCHCADGGEFAFWERRADPTKVVFFLDGGGACYDATTCAFLPEDPAYDWNVRGDDPSQDGGIFDLGRGDNPFRDYSFVFVPSLHR